MSMRVDGADELACVGAGRDDDVALGVTGTVTVTVGTGWELEEDPPQEAARASSGVARTSVGDRFTLRAYPRRS